MASHAINVSEQIGISNHERLLQSYVTRRAHGEPLQYILGSEYFGDLEIKCRAGVLIPRPETAALTTYLAKLLGENYRNVTQAAKPSSLRVLDLCTGTGCIPLLLHHEFYDKEQSHETILEVVGIDISSDALSLARENLVHQIAAQGRSADDELTRRKSLQSICFVQADVLSTANESEEDAPPPLLKALERLQEDDALPKFDVLISNPPYISPNEFRHTTTRSVREFEPKLALVPAEKEGATDVEIGDYFYPRLLEIAERVSAKTFLVEVADMEQAQRVAAMSINQGIWDEVEIWRDEPESVQPATETTTVQGKQILVRGEGHGRAVFARRP